MLEDSITINLPPSIRDRSRGRFAGQRKKLTIEIESDPIVAVMDMAKLEGRAARALADIIRERIRRTSRRVAEATEQRREHYLREFNAGRRTATKRYRGSARARIPPTPPMSVGKDRWLNDSGRLAVSVVATFNPKAGDTGGWTLNVAENRLNAIQFGRGFEAFISEFSELIDIPSATRETEYVEAVRAAIPDVIGHLRAIGARKRAELWRQYGRLGGTALNAIRAVLG